MSDLTTKNDPLEMVVLAVLAEQPRYGYAIIKRLSVGSGGTLRTSPGVLYPLLSMLEKDGLITATWETVRSERSVDDPEGGRRRKWYTLSPKGKKRLEQRIAAHRAHHEMLEAFLSTPGEGGGKERTA